MERFGQRGAGSPKRAADGTVTWQGFVYDITERKLAERRAQRDRMRLQHALEVADLGLFDHDLVTGEFHASPRFRELARLPQEGPIALAELLDKLEGRDRQRIDTDIEKAHDPSGNGIHRAEHRVVRPDKTVRWVSLSAQTQFEGIGSARKPVRTIGAIADITDRKEAEERQKLLLADLAASEAEARHQRMLFQSMFQCAPDAILVTDMSCKILRINPAFERTFQYTPAELAGVATKALYADYGDLQTVARVAADHARHPVMPPKVLAFKRKDETTFSGVITGAVLRHEGGDDFGYIALIRDVSDEIRREKALQQSKRLEAVGRLTGGISHDFNNLLTVVSGNLQFIGDELRDQKNERLSRYLQEAERAAAMGARLNRRLMTFARKRQLAPAPTDLNQLANSIVELIRRSFGDQIVVKTDFPAEAGLVSIDPTEMESALLNLAFNARDAMPTGGTLCIATSNAEFDDSGPNCAETATHWPLRPAPRHRQRFRHAARSSGARLRAVLHHKGDGQGLRPRPRDRPWLCAAIGWPRRHRKRSRTGYHGNDIAAAPVAIPR